MRINFDLSIFRSKEEEKISVKMPKDMVEAIDQLAEVIGLDRSKTIRWCVENILKEAYEQNKLPKPGAA